MKSVIHIGLPKTGTTFLGHNYFLRYPLKKYAYNPPAIMRYLKLLMRNNITDLQYNSYKEEIKKEILKEKKDNIFILYEELSEPASYSIVWPYNKYSDTIIKKLTLIEEIFPSPTIIVSLRYQVEWLRSMYYMQFDYGPQQLTIKDYLNYRDNKFQSLCITNKKSNISIYNVDYPYLIQILYDKFSKDRVKIIFYESLKLDSVKYIKNVYNILEEAHPEINNFEVVNKKLSAMSIKICIMLGKYFNQNKLSAPHYFPFREYLSRKQPLYIEMSYELFKQQTNKDYFRYIYSRLYYKMYNLTFKNLIQNTIDRFQYINNDPIKSENMLDILNNHYKSQNKILSNMIAEQYLPDNYL